MEETTGSHSARLPQHPLGQIYNAIAYYCDRQAEIDSEIAEEELLAESLRPKRIALKPKISRRKTLAKNSVL